MLPIKRTISRGISPLSRYSLTSRKLGQPFPNRTNIIPPSNMQVEASLRCRRWQNLRSGIRRGIYRLRSWLMPFRSWVTRIRGYLSSLRLRVQAQTTSLHSASRQLLAKKYPFMSTIGEIKMQQALDRARIMREAMEHTTTPPKIQPVQGPQSQTAAQ